MIQKKINITDIPIEEVWRYLGRSSQLVSHDLEDLVQDVIKETVKTISPQALANRVPLNREGSKLSVQGIDLPGEGIKRHLESSDEAFILAVTLGYDIERLIKRYELTDLTRAVIMDACASVAVEVACDTLSRDLALLMKLEKTHTTSRFSPGYSDLPLSLQPQILDELQAQKKIGLTASENDLLSPRKSVTALVGITDEVPEIQSRCASCLLQGKCSLHICE